jgi:phenylalanyl-tRNA synthetase beta chain
MKFLFSWIKEFVDIPENPAELAEILSMAGLEVDAIETSGQEILGITTGKILSITKHPDADKLVITSVSDGKDTHQIVTGATNISVGDIVPVALPGGVVSGGLHIKSAKLRGVDSHGMLCSEKELGVSTESKGIWILDEQTPLGLDFIAYASLKETIFDIAILPNRGDCQSVIGIARDIAALSKKPLKLPSISLNESSLQNPFSVTVKEPDLCPLYVGRYLSGLKNSKSPLFMQRRLQLSGIRSVSLIVDISNYVLLEMGQPLHAFDAKKCSPNFSIENAGSLQSIRTLDSEMRKVDSDCLVIKNDESIVALAGIIGGSSTEVDDSTDSIFLEAAYFDATAIRRSAKKLGLRTESSVRFEKGLDIHTVEQASKRAAQLLQEYAHATVSSDIRLVQNRKSPLFQTKHIPYNHNQINAFLGTSYSENDCENSLKSLGFTVHKNSVEVPSWRQKDIESWPCLAEEIARLQGFDSIPSTPSSNFVLLDKPSSESDLISKIHGFFATNGFSELCTYPMISVEEARLFDETNLNDHCVLENPITPELAVMRASLLPSHLNIHKHHSTRQMSESAFFEIAKVFHNNSEQLHLAASIKGSFYTDAYTPQHNAIRSSMFEQLKGVFERFIAQISVDCLCLSGIAPNWAHPSIYADIMLGNQRIGSLSLLHPALLKRADISESIAYLELSVQPLVSLASARPQYHAFSAFPSTRRDIALLVPKTLLYSDILKVIDKFKHKSVKDVFIFDVFESEKLGKDQRSIAIGFIYQDDKGTLADSKVNGAHENLCQQLTKALPVSIR